MALAETRGKGASGGCGGVMERLSLKSQILITYSLMATVVCGISIALSLIMFKNLQSSVANDSTGVILRQSSVNAQDLSSEIVEAAAQRLRTLSNSMNKITAKYSKILLTTTDSTRPAKVPPFKLLVTIPTYAEFNFTVGCVETGGCPTDYGPLSTRSKFPYVVGSENGSLIHTSTYLYSSATNKGIRNTPDWEATFAGSQALADVRDAIAVQDEDYAVMYSNNGSYITFLYLAAKVVDSRTGHHHALFANFPGVTRDLGSYDPSARPWFTGAREDVTHVLGPYVEPLTGQRVVTLSFKQAFMYMNDSVEIVAASAVNVDSLRELVMSIAYANDGFAVIYNAQTMEVLTWANRTDLVSSIGVFKTVYDMDPMLPKNLCANEVFEYHDATGTEWLAGCASAYNASVSVSETRNVWANVFTVIVFSKRAMALEPLTALHDNMNDSATNIRDHMLVVVLCLSFVVMLLVLATVWNITSPLNTMRRVALQVIDQMAEDEEARDFAPVLNKAGFNVDRSDEVGVLASDFYQVMCLMHNKVVAKRAVTKYPPNPWRLECEGEEDAAKLSTLTWQDLRSVDSTRPAKAQAVQTAAHADQVTTRVKGSELSASHGAASIRSSHRASHRSSNRSTYSGMKLGGRVAPLGNDSLATITQSKPVGWLTCLKTQLSTLAALLVAGVVGAMLATVLTVQRDGSSWSHRSAEAMTVKQVANLRSIVAAKAVFVEVSDFGMPRVGRDLTGAQAFFSQMALDMRTTATSMTSLLMGDYTRPTWEADGDYLYSYSTDNANPYALNPHGRIYPFSSYFRYPDANCSTALPPTCDVTRNSTQARLTSLLDIKMESLFYPNTYLSYIQTGHDDTGFVRLWPLRYMASYSVPTVCWPEVADIPLCERMIATTKCGNASVQTYPVYDPRCRAWYGLARTHPSTEVPSFMHPRLIIDGTYVLTSVLNIANRTSGQRLAVVNLNFLVSKLKSSITDNPIMSHGYNYLVDAQSIDTVIIHPQQTVSCSTVECAEGMTAQEYATFKSSVLLAGSGAKDTYVKAGQVWRVATHPMRYGSVDYLVVGTVPDWEVVEFATKAHDTIDQATQEMVVGFGVAIAAVVVCMTYIIANMVRLITKPLDDLRLVIGLALRKDFTKELPKQAGSADMAALMHAITQLLVALRLDACAGDTADIRHTHAVFVDSVNLFTATGNRKGLGASLSNLAALELATGDVAAAQEHYQRSIELAKELVAQLESSSGKRGDVEAGADGANDLRRARRVLSDRQGNLAATLLEKREAGAASALLDQVLEDDKRNLHIRGCIAKQSMLGRVLLRQLQLADAERVFTASLALVRELQQSSAVRGSAMSEADACEMLALCDLATLAEARSWRTTLESLQALEHKYLEALMVPAHMELGTARRVLRSLLALYGRHPQFAEAKRVLQGIADAHGLGLSAAAVEGMAVAKRVVLVLDYSSSMAGSRVRSVKDALHTFMKEHIHARDSVAILSFNNSVQEVLPLTVKAGNAMYMAKRVESMVAPVGGTALYDGVLQALKVLAHEPTAGDWIVLLADGADDKSKSAGGLDHVLHELAASRASVVALGIGAEAPEVVLTRIAQASPRSFSMCLPATKVDISDLFDQAARLLHSTQVMLEEY